MVTLIPGKTEQCRQINDCENLAVEIDRPGEYALGAWNIVQHRVLDDLLDGIDLKAVEDIAKLVDQNQGHGLVLIFDKLELFDYLEHRLGHVGEFLDRLGHLLHGG